MVLAFHKDVVLTQKGSTYRVVHAKGGLVTTSRTRADSAFKRYSTR